MSATSLLLGLDVSPKRLGWGLVDLVTGEPVACGMEPIDLPSGGWHHEQVTRAIERINNRMHVACTNPQRWGEVQAVYIEHPISRFPGMAYDEGQAMGIVRGEVERRWSWAPIETLKPAEWRKLAGLPGNASKEAVYLHALELIGEEVMPTDSRVIEWVVPGGQDAADALLIAVAGWHRNEDVIERAAVIAARDEERA